MILLYSTIIRSASTYLEETDPKAEDSCKKMTFKKIIERDECDVESKLRQCEEEQRRHFVLDNITLDQPKVTIREGLIQPP
jgi:hypothetical protein